MSLKIAQLPTFDGIPASTTAVTPVSIELNRGELVHALWLQASVAAGSVGLGTLQAPTLLGYIRLKIDGTTYREVSAQRLAVLNALNNPSGGSQYSTKTSGTGATLVSYLPIFLAEPWRQGVFNAQGIAVPEAAITAWPVTSRRVTLEVELAASLTSPILTGFYEYEPTNQKMGKIIAWETHNISVSSASPGLTVEKFGGNENEGIQVLSLFPTIQTTSAYVSSLKFSRNKDPIRDAVTRYQNDAILISRGLSPTALDLTSDTTIKNTGAYHLVMDYDDPIRQTLAVKGFTEVTMTPTFNTAPAGALEIVVQKIVTP